MFKIAQRFDGIVNPLIDTDEFAPPLRCESKVAWKRYGAGAVVRLPLTKLDPARWGLRGLGDQNIGEPLGCFGFRR